MDEKSNLDEVSLNKGGASAPLPNHDKSKSNKLKKKKSHWALISTLSTFVLASIFSLLSTLSSAYISVSAILLVFLIFLNIAFDGIGVAVTAAELPPLLAMASRRAPGSRMAVKLVKNAEKVANICSDIIGDICGIVSGACGLSLVYALLRNSPSRLEFWIVILFSSVISALTVGGKAVIKEFSIKNSKSIIIAVARLLSLFSSDPREKRERDKEKRKKYERERAKQKDEDEQ